MTLYVNHDILHTKLEKYLIKGIFLSFIESYVTNRMQIVNIKKLRTYTLLKTL